MPILKEPRSRFSKPHSTDPAVPFVPLTLKGREFRLIYSFNALAEAETLTKLNLFHGLDLKNLNLRELRAMLWSALQHYHPELTIEQAGELIGGPVECNLVLDAVSLAWLASMPTRNDDSPN